MKQLKNSLTLLGALAVVLAVIFVVNTIRSRSAGKSDGIFDGFTPEGATALVIKGTKEAVTLERIGTWVVTSADSFPADTAHLGRVFNIIAGMDDKTLVSQNPAKQNRFQVDTTAGLRVTVKAGDKVAADFYLGKNGPGYNSTYFRPAGSDNVYLYGGKSIKYEFGENGSRWKDTFIMKFDKDRLASFTLAYADKKIEVGKGADLAWRLLQPEDVPAKQNEIAPIINAISSMGSKDMERAGGAMAYGFDRPQCTVTAVLADGTTCEAVIGSRVPDSKEELYYARRSDRAGFVYTLRKYQLDNISKEFEELKEDPPPVPDSTAAVN